MDKILELCNLTTELLFMLHLIIVYRLHDCRD